MSSQTATDPDVSEVSEVSDSSSSESDLAELLILTDQALTQMEVQENEAESSRRHERRKRRYINRDRSEANANVLRHYFADESTYPDEYFRRRFRMRRPLFLQIVEGISNYSVEPLPDYFKFFKQRPDATGKMGFSCLHKCVSAIRLMAYEITPDAFDEYLQISERTSTESLDNFLKCIIHLYTNVYLRTPTQDDVNRLYQKHDEVHGFKGMLGSIDCMHWRWDQCPNAYKGQYTRGDHGHPTVMLEAVASYDLWIWHAYFGVAGSNNDINVLKQSSLFHDMLNDSSPDYSFSVNGHAYNKGYYLADGIYPEWATFVKAFSYPPDEPRQKFKRFQESARKDIERAFGVLQGRWGIIKHAARFYKMNKLRRVVYGGIILHNMIVEDNGRAICDAAEWYAPPRTNASRSYNDRVNERIRINNEIRDRDTHHQLRNDLVAYISTLPENYRER